MNKFTDKTTTIQSLKDLVIKFGKERHWRRHHMPKNVAMGIAIEAAELMEHYQWDQPIDKEAVEYELADVLFNVLNFAYVENIDIAESFMKKYDKLLKKYPLEKFSKDIANLDEYKRIKQSYRKKKT